jgi:hypothetical protein
VKFNNTVKRSNKIQKQNTDVIRGEKKRLTTDVYEAKVTKAYIYTTKSGANFIKAEFKTDSNQIINFSECFQSGDAKGNAIYYTDKNGNDIELPGYSKFNELLVSVLEEELVIEGADGAYIGDIFDLYDEGGVEEKKIPIYDSAKGKEVPTEVPVVTAILNKPVKLGVFSVFLDKPAKENGRYVYLPDGSIKPSGGYYMTPQVNKFFNAFSNKTCNEFMDNNDAAFMEQWLAAYKDKVFDYTANKIAPVVDGKIVPRTDAIESAQEESSPRKTYSRKN